MVIEGRYFSGEMEPNRVHAKLGMWIIMAFITFGLMCPPILTMAAPVVIDEDSNGSWEDDFEDTTGIEMWDSLVLNGENIELINIPIFSDNFTGTDGDPPNSTKWNITDDGQTLEIQNNYLKASGISAPGVWVKEYVLSKNPISVNHTLTWRANIHTLGTGMYYHFGIINGSDDSGLIGVSQNYLGNYGVYNYYASSGTSIGSWVSGWHDYKVTFNSGIIEFYFDGVKKFEYDFNVTSVRYQFGARIFAEQTCILYSDDVLITSYANAGNLTSTEIILPNGQTWESLIVNKSEYDTENRIKVTILDGGTYQPIPGFENLTGTDIDISAIDNGTHPTIRLQAHFSSSGNASPVLHSWKVTWLGTIPPATPTGFAVNNPFTGYSLILSWNSNNETYLERYVLYYSTDNITFTWLTNISAGTLSFIHYGLNQGITYYYKLAAADEIPNQSPFSAVTEGTPDLDYDGDNIGDADDPDDDNDGINDIDDPYPLNPLNDIEATVDDLNTTVIDIQNRVIDIQLDIDTLNTSLSDIQYDIDYLNQTIPSKIDQISNQLSEVNSSLTDRVSASETSVLNYITSLNSSLSADIQNLLVSITSDLIGMNASLSEELINLLTTMTTEHNALQQWLDIVLNEIDSNLTATNDTLHQQLNALDASVTSFYNSLTDDISDIDVDLKEHDDVTGQNHSIQIDLLNQLLDGQIEKEKIEELRTFLINLAQNLSEHNLSIANDIMGVVNDIDEFETETDEQLQDINHTLDQLAQLEEILDDLEALDQSLDQAEEDIQDSIDDRSTKDEDEERFFVMELLILIVLILLVINMIMTLLIGRRKEPAQPSLIPQPTPQQSDISPEPSEEKRAPPRPPSIIPEESKAE